MQNDWDILHDAAGYIQAEGVDYAYAYPAYYLVCDICGTDKSLPAGLSMNEYKEILRDHLASCHSDPPLEINT